MDYESVGKLILDPANARKHDARNLEAIKGSLARFGQQKPIIVDNNNVVRAGNGTLAAARELGWDKVWVHRSTLAGVEMTAFALADNRTAELATWDEEALKQTLISLQELDFDITEIGFDELTFDDEQESEGMTYGDTAHASSPPPKPVTGAKELSESEFKDFAHTCPRCNFEFGNV